MAEQWYCARGNDRFGPYSDDDMRSLIRDGRIGPATRVWNETFSGWEPAGSVPSLQPLFAERNAVHAAPVEYVVRHEQRSSSTAVASFVLGILSCLIVPLSCCVPFVTFPFAILPILAVIFGHVALAQASRSPEQYSQGLAIAGLVLGYAMIALVVVMLVLVLFVGMAPLLLLDPSAYPS